LGEEEAFIKETKALLAIPEEERIKYVKEVLSSLNSAVSEILKAKSLVKKKKLFNRFIREFEEKGTVLMTCFLYAVKPEFREQFIDFLRILVGEERKVFIK